MLANLITTKSFYYNFSEWWSFLENLAYKGSIKFKVVNISIDTSTRPEFVSVCFCLWTESFAYRPNGTSQAKQFLWNVFLKHQQVFTTFRYCCFDYHQSNSYCWNVTLKQSRQINFWLCYHLLADSTCLDFNTSCSWEVLWFPSTSWYRWPFLFPPAKLFSPDGSLHLWSHVVEFSLKLDSLP